MMRSIKLSTTEVPLNKRSAPFIDSIMVSTEGVIKLLKGLNPPKALDLMNLGF